VSVIWSYNGLTARHSMMVVYLTLGTLLARTQTDRKVEAYVLVVGGGFLRTAARHCVSMPCTRTE
jgi:hypothetical protein